MIITYTNGQTIPAALVVRTDNRLRVVLAGSDDVTEFTQINGSTWVSEECETVSIEFGFRGRTNHKYTEEDFACSHELAARLIHLLLNPEEDAKLSTAPPVKSFDPASCHLAV